MSATNDPPRRATAQPAARPAVAPGTASAPAAAARPPTAMPTPTPTPAAAQHPIRRAGESVAKPAPARDAVLDDASRQRVQHLFRVLSRKGLIHPLQHLLLRYRAGERE